MSGSYDVRAGGIQRVHSDTPGRCWEWARVACGRAWAIHVSTGGEIWWRPNLGRLRYHGVTEWRAGWLWLAVQVARRYLRDQAPGVGQDDESVSVARDGDGDE